MVAFSEISLMHYSPLFPLQSDKQPLFFSSIIVRSLSEVTPVIVMNHVPSHKPPSSAYINLLLSWKEKLPPRNSLDLFLKY